MAMLQSSNGSTYTCNSAATSCSVTNVPCGQNYSVSVAVNGQTCNSTASTGAPVASAPCVPQNVSANMNCGSNMATVTWQGSQGALLYFVNANSSNAQTANCTSTTTSCNLSLPVSCGVTYTISVMASNNNCSSACSTPVQLQSVPCQPFNLSVNISCGISSALVSWATQAGAVQYVVTAQSPNATALYCQSTNTSCFMTGLQCGTVYNFTVLASAQRCNSSYSNPLTVGIAPCPPTNLSVIPSVVWGPMQLLRAYWSAVDCPNSHYLLEISGNLQGDTQTLIQLESYWANRTYFETPMPCSSNYRAMVRAQNAGGTSAPSAALTGTTVPCDPASVTFTGSNSSAVLSWNASFFTTLYYVYQITLTGGRTLLCNTSQLSCTVTNINSNLIIVTASNAAGESSGTPVTLVSSSRRRRDLEETNTNELAKPDARVTLVTATSLRLEWSSVQGAERYNLLYQEQYNPHVPKPYMVITRDVVSNLSNLRPATTYCAAVCAMSPSSTRGPYSKPICVQTATLR
ncbi:fibronectin type III domain-containing protein 7-like [Brachyhypopomus gauderio]|uniref:fibronectin type III domain-containing protein 7-like n=1 Tax=Brachyhypopomus gauderio TaxID=698409 RepID=UPI0040428715